MDVVEKFRNCRPVHLDKVKEAGHDTMHVYRFVYVLVEADMSKNPMQPKAEGNINEAIVSSIHIQKWCPMVAYSSCSCVFTKPKRVSK